MAILIVSQQEFAILDPHEASGRINPVDITFTAPENAVQLAASPAEVESRATYIVDVDEAIVLLENLDFRHIPLRIGSKELLNDIVFENHARGKKLSSRQIREFDRKIEERFR